MDTDRLAELVAQKREILTQLHGLTERQWQLIRDGDMARLLSLLAAKQSFLNHLQKVERHIDPFRMQDPEQRQWRSPTLRQEVRRAASESEALLEQILKVEQQCESQMTHRRDDAAARLQGIHDSTQARAAYLQGEMMRPSQLDISSDS